MSKLEWFLLNKRIDYSITKYTPDIFVALLKITISLSLTRYEYGACGSHVTLTIFDLEKFVVTEPCLVYGVAHWLVVRSISKFIGRILIEFSVSWVISPFYESVTVHHLFLLQNCSPHDKST